MLAVITLIIVTAVIVGLACAFRQSEAYRREQEDAGGGPPPAPKPPDGSGPGGPLSSCAAAPRESALSLLVTG